MADLHNIVDLAEVHPVATELAFLPCPVLDAQFVDFPLQVPGRPDERRRFVASGSHNLECSVQHLFQMCIAERLAREHVVGIFVLFCQSGDGFPTARFT
jgi:hypothetical protein